MIQKSRIGSMKDTTEGGEIVQVDGGHILRSTGRKDRHSKVYTAKGPRDRRVRLAAHTAIQFYDVQDRLGFDRPSKAVDWLIKKAKSAIDKLGEPPPPWRPNDINQIPTPDSNPSSDHQPETPLVQCINNNNNNDDNTTNPGCSNLPFMAAAAPPDDLMHTMKSVFPTTNFPGFSNGSVSRASEDLGLSLHSFQAADSNQGNSNNQMLPFQENFQTWNNGGDDHMDSRVGFLMNSLSSSQRPLFSDQGLPFSHVHQSNLGAVNHWNQRPLALIDQHDPQPCSSKSSDFEGAFELGFHVPARIYGDEEQNNHR